MLRRSEDAWFNSHNLEGLSLRTPSHPLAVGEQSDNAKGDDEDNAENQDHAGLTSSPVASLENGGKAVCLGAAGDGNGRHLD